MPLAHQKPIGYREVRQGDRIVKVPRYRRTLADKGKRVEPEQILQWIEKKRWKYSWDK